MLGNHIHKSEYIFPYCVLLDTMLEQNPELFLGLYSRSVSEFFVLVDLIPCSFMCRCTIVVFVDLYTFLLINPSVRPGRVFSKT